MVEIKKNKIWIGRNGNGYSVHKNDRVCSEKSISSYCWPNSTSFYDVLDLLINISDEFYEKGINLNFDKKPMTEIPFEEKDTIEKLVKKLEYSAIKNKNLKKSLIQIKKVSSEY
jgi:hypothetical protein